MVSSLFSCEVQKLQEIYNVNDMRIKYRITEYNEQRFYLF